MQGEPFQLVLLWSAQTTADVKYGVQPEDFHMTLSSLHLNHEGVTHAILTQEVTS